MCESDNNPIFARMKTRISITYIKLLAAVLVIVVGILAVNSTANYHLHRLPNGQIVAHSHPFNNTSDNNCPIKTHSHSQFELFFFSSILLLFFVGVFHFAKNDVAIKTTGQLYNYLYLLENTPVSITNKAPPFVL